MNWETLSSEKEIKDECFTNDHKCTEPSCSEWLHQQPGEFSHKWNSFYENPGILIMWLQMGLWHVQAKQNLAQVYPKCLHTYIKVVDIHYI